LRLFEAGLESVNVIGRDFAFKAVLRTF